MLKTEGLGKIQICIYETYKNTVMPHERHIYAKACISPFKNFITALLVNQ